MDQIEEHVVRREMPQALNELSGRVIACAIEVHRALGPGLLERLYEDAFTHELRLNNVQVGRQVPVTFDYKGLALVGQRLDLVVEERIVVELKSVEIVADVHVAQLLSYLRAGRYPLGLVINFNVKRLVDGITRRINSSAPALYTPAALSPHSPLPSAISAPPLRSLR